MTKHYTRRTALQSCTALILAGASLKAEAVNQKLDPNDPAAKKLGYVERAAAVDSKLYPTYQRGQSCANCKLIQLRYGPLRPCTLFPGKMVLATGWCNGWTPQSFDK